MSERLMCCLCAREGHLSKDCPMARALNPFKQLAGEAVGQPVPEFRRASGSCVCQACGLEYRRHAYSEHRDWNDDPFLNVLCNGDLVKL